MMRVEMTAPFTCQQCGNCCHTDGWVYVTPQEADAIARFLGLFPADFIREKTCRDNGWLVISSPFFQPECFLTEKGHCSIYPLRPRGCRTYPFEFQDAEEFREALDICDQLRLMVECETARLSEEADQPDAKEPRTRHSKHHRQKILNESKSTDRTGE